MTHFKENLAVIQQRFPNIVNRIVEIEEDSLNASSLPEEPLKKDEAWLEAVKGSVGDIKVVFVYGFSQGVALADLLETYPDRFFIVYEPDEVVFRNSMHTYDMRELLAWPQLLWVAVGESQLKMLFYKICTYMDQELAFVALRHHLEERLDLLQEIKHDFEEYHRTFLSNRRTEKHFQKTWIENSLKQLSGMLTSPSITELAGVYSGSTAVIIASGPSLEKDIEWVRKFQNHALIISAGSSIQALIKHNIVPHLATIMDGGSINAKVFENPKTLAPPLLYGSTAYHGVSDQKKSETIHAIIQNDNIGKYCMGMSEQDPTILPTPTVTGTAIQAAAWLGASRIVMMGQDLSFQEGKFYANGVEHSDEKYSEQVVKQAQHTVHNVDGGLNQTTESFLYMKDGLESLISMLPNIEFVNATRGGAVIEGTIWKPAEDVYKQIKHQSIENDSICKLLARVEFPQLKEKVTFVKSRVEHLLLDFASINEELGVMQKQIDKLQIQSRSNASKAWKTMESIEMIWGKIAEREWFSSVFETLLSDQLGDFDRILPEIAIEKDIRKKSDLVYRYLGGLGKDIQGEVPFIQKLLSESLEKMAEIKV